MSIMKITCFENSIFIVYWQSFFGTANFLNFGDQIINDYYSYSNYNLKCVEWFEDQSLIDLKMMKVSFQVSKIYLLIFWKS